MVARSHQSFYKIKMEKSLDRKIERILADQSCNDFILADAKDGDMGFGIACPGERGRLADGTTQYRSLEEYRQAMRDITKQALIGYFNKSVCLRLYLFPWAAVIDPSL